MHLDLPRSPWRDGGCLVKLLLKLAVAFVLAIPLSIAILYGLSRILDAVYPAI
jgi:hypothetical protein